MFDQLRKAFSNATKSIGQRDLSEKDLDNSLRDLQLGLLESDVAQEVIDDFSAKLKKELLGLKLEKDDKPEELIRSKFQNVIAEMFAKTGKVDLIDKIKTKRELKCGPFIVLFLGINGTGKTTTVAKIANLLRKNGISVVLAAADTHRAGAIEQLTQHAQKLALKVVAQRYGADPSAVGRDAVDYGRKHHIDAVLIDTAGRMQTAKNLMDEIGKIVKVVKPDIKIFIGDSLAGNDTINQAREFFEYTKFDGAILTKIDADAKGGSAISIVYTTSKPIVYLGVGQGYDDIIPFDMSKFLQSVFWNTHITNLENSVFRLEQDSEPTGEPRSATEPLSNDPSERPASEILNPVITGAKESKGDAKPTEEEKSKCSQSSLSQSIMPIAEQENNTKPAESIDKTDGSQTPYFEKNRREDIELPNKREDAPLIEKKKNRFSSFFRRRKNNKQPGIVEETDTDRTDENEKNMERSNLSKDETGKKGSNRESGEKENQEKEQPNDEKIYLTDEDIEDLLK
ncbi:MAG: signal recognition particle-docking protein FtsY [Candidatus Nitrosopolaris sp.]